MTPVSIMWDVWDPLGLHLNQKDLKSGKKWLSFGQFPIGRLRDLNEYHTGCIGSLGLHLNQRHLKSGKKQLSYGQFTSGRLRDSSEYHAGCIGSFRAVFEPKRSKIGQEMAEFWPIYNWEVA